MNFEIPRIWADRLNAGDVDGVVSLYDENALLLATFDAEPLAQPAQRRKYFEGFMGRPGAGVELDDTTLCTTGSRKELTRRQGLYTFFIRMAASLFDNTPVLLLSFRLIKSP